MKAENKSFFLNSIERFRSLDGSQQALWGRMTPQHMVEHIVGSWRISNGRARVKPVLSEEEIQEKRDFLFSDQDYPKNIPNPVFSDGLPPLRKAGLREAIDQLEDEMLAFFEYHDAHPAAIKVHPVFGPLDFAEWMLFQTKHMKHHMKQFGLI